MYFIRCSDIALPQVSESLSSASMECVWTAHTFGTPRKTLLVDTAIKEH